MIRKLRIENKNCLIKIDIKKKLLVSFLFVFFISSLNAQVGKVGINTETPQTTLDVNGSIQLRNELQVNGSAGNEGDIYFSQGNATLNKWNPVNVPFLEDGQYQLVNTFAIKDQVGIDFTGNGYDPSLSSLGETFGSKNWTHITGLNQTIKIKDPNNKSSMLFQTGVESRMDPGNNTSNQVEGNIKYTCGLFRRLAADPQSSSVLVAMRASQINNVPFKTNEKKSQSVFTLNYTVLNMPVGEYVFSVGCRRMSLSGGGGSATTSLLSIGNAVNSGAGNTNDFMLNSVLKIDVIELVVVTGN